MTKYCIFYNWSSRHTNGTGVMEVFCEHPITGIDGLLEIEAIMRPNIALPEGATFGITNWKRFEEEEPQQVPDTEEI